MICHRHPIVREPSRDILERFDPNDPEHVIAFFGPLYGPNQNKLLYYFCMVEQFALRGNLQNGGRAPLGRNRAKVKVGAETSN